MGIAAILVMRPKPSERTFVLATHTGSILPTLPYEIHLQSAQRF